MVLDSAQRYETSTDAKLNGFLVLKSMTFLNCSVPFSGLEVGRLFSHRRQMHLLKVTILKKG